MVKDCEKLKKEKEKIAQRGKSTQKRFTVNVVLVARETIPKRDVGKGLARISSPSAPDQRTRRTTMLTPKPQNPITNQHHPVPNLHQARTIQKTSVATTPI